MPRTDFCLGGLDMHGSGQTADVDEVGGLAIASRDSCYGIHLTRDHDRHIIEDDFLVEYSSKSQ